MTMVHLTLAGVTVAQAEIPTSIAEHIDVIWLLLVVAIAVITWFAVRAFNRFADNQAELFRRMNGLEQSHQHLLGEHQMMCKGVQARLDEFIEAVYPLIERRQKPR